MIDYRLFIFVITGPLEGKTNIKSDIFLYYKQIYIPLK